jgi:hypothetical protein
VEVRLAREHRRRRVTPRLELRESKNPRASLGGFSTFTVSGVVSGVSTCLGRD